MTGDDARLFEALGGRAGIACLVYDFYQRVLDDPELSPFFRDVPMEKLQSMQIQFFSAALGGAHVYQGRSIAHAHHHLRIARHHLQRFTDLLFETLAGLDLSEQDRYDIIARINLQSDDVLGPGAGLSE